MRTRIFCPDIECDSCVKLLKRAINNFQGVEGFSFDKKSVEVEYNEHMIRIESIVQAIKDKGYRASVDEFSKKTIKERAREFISNKTKYSIEYRLIKQIVVSFVLLLLANIWVYANYPDYTWWFFYLALSVVTISGAALHFKTYRAEYTCMVGMMIGMTIGMQTGMMVGFILGITNGFFVGALVGMLLGSIVGAYTGNCCGIMGVMEGMMAGIMGGTMGPMISVMMFNDHIAIFSPFYFLLNILILAGMAYMIFEEVVEDNENIIKKPVGTVKFIGLNLLVFGLISLIVYLAPASIFMG